jgi:hypothetical protein
MVTDSEGGAFLCPSNMSLTGGQKGWGLQFGGAAAAAMVGIVILFTKLAKMKQT